jgi:uncharacterized protein YjbJ (UPF0337 family)
MADAVRGDAAYPDTGYPSPYSESREKLDSESGYATGAYGNPSRSVSESTNELATAPRSRSELGGSAAVTARPERGFYGDDYESRFSEASAGHSASAQSRYADPVDDGLRDTASESRFGDSSVSQARSSESWAQDSDQDFESLNRYAEAEVAEKVEQYQERADELAGQALGDTESTRQDLGTATRQLTQDLRETYGEATNRVRDRLQGGVDAIAGSGRTLTQEATDVAQRAMDDVGQRTAQVGGELRDGYSRFAQQANNTMGDVDDTAQQGVARAATAASGTLDRGYDQYGDSAQEPYGRASQDEAAAQASLPVDRYDAPTADSEFDSPPAESLGARAESEFGATDRPRRATQPWRPGSIGTAPSTRFDATQNRRTDYDRVQPASYPGSDRTSDRRLAPSYR